MRRPRDTTQSWTRDPRYHPHVHYLVPALAFATDSQRWLVGKRAFLVHVKPLAQLFRAKFRAELGKTVLLSQVKARVWAQAWVIDCRGAGSGAAALKYLAPYIFRIALSNNRIERLVNDQVTFRYTEGKSGERKRETLAVDAFTGRFLSHTRPLHGLFVKFRVLLNPAYKPVKRLYRDLNISVIGKL